MFRVQPIGSEIQYSFGQKTGAVRIVHPISGSLIFGPEMRRRIICSKAARDPAPFFSSNTSQASDRGRVVNLTKVPPPATWLNGRLSLNKKGAPGSNPTKGALLLGDRKSTRLNSSHANISYAVFCLKKKKHINISTTINTA